MKSQDRLKYGRIDLVSRARTEPAGGGDCTGLSACRNLLSMNKVLPTASRSKEKEFWCITRFSKKNICLIFDKAKGGGFVIIVKFNKFKSTCVFFVWEITNSKPKC